MTNFKKAALAAVMTATAIGASPALAGPTTASASPASSATSAPGAVAYSA